MDLLGLLKKVSSSYWVTNIFAYIQKSYLMMIFCIPFDFICIPFHLIYNMIMTGLMMQIRMRGDLQKSLEFQMNTVISAVTGQHVYH